MRTLSKLMAGSAMLAVALATSPAQAQDAPAADEVTGNEIIVTAQRRDEALQEVPIAVSAFQGDQLNAAGVDSVLELAKVTPSLLITEGSSQAQPFIRGVGGRNITPGNEATTAVYIDGVYQTDKTGILLQSFPDVESVQVLRGPQGTLFGRNATSGAILVTTKRPADEFGAMIEGTYGTDQKAARTFVTGPLGETLAFGVAGFYDRKSDYLRNRNPSNGEGSHTGGDELYGVRGSLLWEPADSVEVLLQGNYAKGYTRAIMAVQPVGPDRTLGEAVSLPLGIDIRNPRRSYYGEAEPEVRYDTYGGSLRIDWDLGGIGLKSTSAYTHSGSGVQLDLDASPVSLFWFDTDLEGRTYQQEVLLSSQTESPFQWLLGAFYINYRDGYNALDQFVALPFIRNYQNNTVPPALLAASASGLGPTSGRVYISQTNFVTVKSLGLFGEGSYKFGEATKLTLGLRYTDEKHSLDEDNRRVTNLPNGMGGLISIPQTSAQVCATTVGCDNLSTPFSELTYRAVLDHKFSDDVLIYASYNRGFKSGVYNISSVPNVIATEPETIDAFEVGLKSTLAPGLTANVASYYYKYDNLQVPVVDPITNTQKSINAAKATISGLEVELGWNPTRRTSLNAGFSTFFKSEYDSFPNCEIYRPTGAGLAIVPNADCSGTDLPTTPDIMFSLSGSHTIPLGDGEIELAGLFSYIDEFDYASHGFYPAGVSGGVAFPAGEGRAPIQKPIETLNLSATFRPVGDAFYVRVWGEDLLDSNDTYRNVFTTSFGYYTTLTRGITGGVTVGFNFGGQR